MSDLKIYNNGENKVLMSAGDRIIRQPFEFGNGFYNGTNNCWIKISGLSLNQQCTSGIVASKMTISGSYVRNLYNLHNQNGDNYKVLRTSYGSQPLAMYFNSPTVLDLTGAIIGRTYSNFKMVCAFDLSQGAKQMHFDNATYDYASSIANDYPITEIWINAVSSANSATPSSVQKTDAAGRAATFHSFFLFNRKLSNAEMAFLYNNGLGSYFQLTTGLEIYLIMNMAEIIDFSLTQDGSDMRVGCRDVSGFNRHGKIMNLPAGSLEDQLAFANTNLFAPFIQ